MCILIDRGEALREAKKDFSFMDFNDLKMKRIDNGQEFYAFVWEKVGRGTVAG